MNPTWENAMNTMDTQHINKPHGSTVLSPAESQMLQSSLMAMAHANADAPTGPPALSSTPTPNGLLHALKRRWLVAVGLALLAATLLVFSVFTLMPPMYKANIRFRVAARVPGAED